MSQITDLETNEAELKPTEKARLCKWMLKLGGYDGNLEHGSFVRAHAFRVDRIIRGADVKADYERTKRRRNGEKQ